MRILAIVCVAACGGGGGQSPPDAAIPDTSPPGVLTFHHYVIDELRIPQNNSEARTLGLDLNDDLTVDNQLGMVFGTLAGQGFDTQFQITAAIDRGETIALVELGTDNDFQAGAGSFAMFEGTNPNPPPCLSPRDSLCRRHLFGEGTFDIAADDPGNTPLTGSFGNDTLSTTSAGGHLRLTVPLLLTDSPLTVDLIGARVRVTATSDSIMEGIIGGAVTQNDLDTQVIPQMHASFVATVQEDCTGSEPPVPCGCLVTSTGRTLIGLFDENDDCTITLSEVQNNSLIQSLLAPDVTLEGQPALSIGVAIRAQTATF